MPWRYNGETREYVATPCPAVEATDLANPTEVDGIMADVSAEGLMKKKQLTFLQDGAP